MRLAKESPPPKLLPHTLLPPPCDRTTDAAGRRQDLIFVSMENWDAVWRRNQFLCAGLSRRDPRRRILFVGLSRDYTHGPRTGDFRCFTQDATYEAPDFPQITITHPPKFLPTTLAWGRRLNDLLFRRHVAGVAKKLGLHRPLLWLNPHSALHMAGRMGECAVVYDITDDWTQLTQRPWLQELTRAQDRALCQKADAVIVCSERLRELKEGLTDSLHLIPNGVDAAHYLSVSDVAQPLPADAAGWRHPILGYTGTVHPDRVDLALVEVLARRLPAATIALVGPNQLDPAMIQRLKALGNVVLTGPKPYARIPDYMRAFDVCITPHLVTPFTESLNPIKLWEYLAAGKPIIATPVAGFRDYPDLVHLASDAEAFVNKLAQALSEDASVAVQRREEARRHSWASRLDAIEAVLACIPRAGWERTHA